MKIDNDNNKDKDLRESRPGCKLPKKDSPLDVEGVDLGVTTDEIVSMVREGRGRYG